MSDRESTTITAVLLVPHEDDPLGLLALGELGAEPPRAYRCECGLWRDTVAQPHCSCGLVGMDTAAALGLAWDGKPVAEGLDRLWRAYQMPAYSHPYVRPGGIPMSDIPSCCTNLGAVVLLDAQGSEVTP